MAGVRAAVDESGAQIEQDGGFLLDPGDEVGVLGRSWGDEDDDWAGAGDVLGDDVDGDGGGGGCLRDPGDVWAVQAVEVDGVWDAVCGQEGSFGVEVGGAD